MKVVIRKSRKEDMEHVLSLIKELALYEKAPEAVTVSVEDMMKDGFGEKPVFFCDVAVADERIIGIAVYFIKYSTWKGKGVYLEDLIVTESWRGKGVGKMLFDHVVKVSKELNASQLHWQVLDWNEPAINFYKRYPTEFDSEWVNCKLYSEQLKVIASTNTN